MSACAFGMDGRYVTLTRSLYRSSKVWTVTGFLAVGASSVLSIGVMLSSGRLVDAVSDLIGKAGTPSANAVFLANLLLFLALSLLLAGSRAMQAVADGELTSRYVLHVETSFAEACLTPDTLEQFETGEYGKRTGVITEAVEEGFHLRAAPALLEIVGWRLSGALAGIVLLSYHWWIPFLLAVGYWGLSRGMTGWLGTIYDELIEVTGSIRRRSSYLLRLLTHKENAKELRITKSGEWLAGRFEDTWLSAMRQVWHNRRSAGKSLALGLAALVTTQGTVVVALTIETYRGALSPGALVVGLLAMAAMDNLSRLGDTAWHVGRAASVNRELDSMREALSAREVFHRVRPRATGSSDITIEGLSFTYPGSARPALSDVNLHVPGGQSVAIVGRNGAGKSTLASIVCGLYKPSSGRVEVGGARVEPGDGRVAAVFQNFGRYEVSLRENILLGDVAADTDDATIASVLERAGDADFRLRIGLDTVLSSDYEGGVELSGGQWQRVAIARALRAVNGGACVLLLDEPASALDVKSEAELFEAVLVQNERRLTTIVITHRLAVVRNVDRVVVLKDGWVVEDGCHDELVSTGGHYAELLEAQQQRFVGSSDA